MSELPRVAVGELATYSAGSAGVNPPSPPPTISVRDPVTGQQSPPIELRQQERVLYGQLMNQRLSQRLGSVIGSLSGRPIEQRNKLLADAVREAREYAEQQVYRQMNSEDRRARMQAGRQRNIPLPIP